MEEVEYSMSFRIPKIEALEQCPNLTVSTFLNILLEIGFAQKLDNKNRRFGRKLET